MSDNKEGEQQPTNEWGPETPPLFAQPNKPPETEIESGEPVIVMPEETPISAPEKPTVATSARPVPRPEPIIAEESATQTPEVPLTVPVTAIPLEVATTTPSTEEPMTPVLEDEIIPESESPTEEIHIPISIPTETEAPSGTADSAPIESSEPETTPEVTPEAIPIPEREPTIVRPDGELLRSVQEAVDSLPESSAKEEVKERIEELQTSDFTHNDKGEDLGDTFEQKQARINLKVTKLTDDLEELKLPLPTLEEEEEPMAENNIVLQSQLLLNISENNKYNQINRENLERTIRLAATLIGHDQEAIKEAALRQTLEITPGVRTRLIEIVPETLDQIKEYIAKAQEDVVFMSVPGAQESLDSYKRTVDRLEEILLGSIQNYRISEVVTRLRGSLEDSDRRRPEETAEREAGTEEAIEAIPAGGEGGGGEILPPGGERATGSEVLASEALRTNMGLARDEYLDAYLIRKKWFRKRVSPELEKRLREDYMKATLQYAKQIAKEEVEKVNPEVAGAEKQALIEAKMIIESQNERKALSDLEIKRNDEKKEKFTKAQKIRKWMKNHPKTVIFAGIAMGGIPGGLLLGVGAYDLANKYFGGSKPKQEVFFKAEIENDPDKINAKVAQLVEGASRDEKLIDSDKERKRLYDKIEMIEREELKKIRAESPGLSNDQIEARIIGQTMRYLVTREGLRDTKRTRQQIAAWTAGILGPWLGGAFGVFSPLW